VYALRAAGTRAARGCRPRPRRGAALRGRGAAGGRHPGAVRTIHGRAQRRRRGGRGMSTSIQRSGDIVVVEIKGSLSAANVGPFQEEVLSLVDAGARRIVLDCGGLEYVSSAGLRVFYQV